MKRITAAVICLFALSGICGLVYELVWIRLLSHLLGGTTFAISTVLAAFMGGLALGSFYFGRRVDSDPQPLRLYALLELGIAVGGAVVPALIHVLQPAYVAAAHVLPEPALVVLRVVVVILLLLPPTILMGGTLPVLSRFLVRRADQLGRGLGLLYAVNTLGAVLGAFLSGFVLIPALGLIGSTAAAVAGNLVAGGLALLLWRGTKSLPAPETKRVETKPSETKAVAAAEPRKKAKKVPKPRSAPEPELTFVQLAWIFALTGFAALGFELYWTRALHHFLGNSTYAFSAMLTTFLCGLAAGSWIGGRLADRVDSPARLLGQVQVGVALSVAATVPLIWNWLPSLEDSAFLAAKYQPWSMYLWRRFLISFAVMAVPTVLSGMSFPLVNRIGIASLKGLGRDVGRFYFTNTAGSIVGSLVAGFVLLPLLGARNGLLGTACLSAAIGLAVLVKNRRRRASDPVPALAALILLVLIAVPLSNHARVLLSDTQDPGDTVLLDREDPTAHTRVYRKANGEMHMSVDGHHIGGTEANITRKEKILAHLPMMLVPGARSTLSVGLGSGITLGTLAIYDEIQRLVCVEIVPSVVEGARRFASYNNNVLRDPRVDIVTGDGIQYLLTTTETFDIISSDSKLNPEYAGNSVILSRDYYELCRDHLNDDGVMVQWLAMHFPTVETRTVIRSFCEAFAEVELFWIDPNNLILVGARRPVSLVFDRAASLLAEEDVASDLREQMLDDPYVVAGNRVAGRERLLTLLGAGRTNTWLRPNLEFSVVRKYRLKSAANHEDDNFLLVNGLWDDNGLAVGGSYDAERFDRFRISSRKFLLGYGSGGGADRVETGYDELRAGLEHNPDDERLVRLVEMIEQTRSRDADIDPATLQDPTALHDRALRALDAGRAADALALLDRALAIEPTNANLRYTRLQALRRLGRLDEALAAARQYVADNPGEARGISQLGVILGERGDYVEALEYHRQTVEIDPQSAKFAANLATTLARLERYGDGAEAFAQVYELDPTLPGAAYFAAVCFSMDGQTAKAAQWVNTCLEHGMGDPEQFLASKYFENLRASADWDEAAVRRAIEQGY